MSKKSTIDPATLPTPYVALFASPRDALAMTTHHIARILKQDRPQDKEMYLNDLAKTVPRDFFARSYYWRSLLDHYSSQITWLKQKMQSDNPGWEKWTRYGYVLRPEVLSGSTRFVPKTAKDETYRKTDLLLHKAIYKHLGQSQAKALWPHYGMARFYDWRPVLRALEDAQQFRLLWLNSVSQDQKGAASKNSKRVFQDFSDWIKYSDPDLWKKAELVARFREAAKEASEDDWLRLEREVKQPRRRPHEPTGLECKECPKRLRMLRGLRSMFASS
jgi:hypothetical protein